MQPSYRLYSHAAITILITPLDIVSVEQMEPSQEVTISICVSTCGTFMTDLGLELCDDSF
jgi:hypothetical protein